MTSGFSLRVAILGGVALVMFAVIFFRLWYLQVLSGDKYLVEANNNRIREIRVTAPRGQILDRNGHVLVENRTSLALQLNPQKLPGNAGERRAELTRLGHAAGIPLRRMRRDMHDQLKVLASAPVTLQRDVNYDLVYYLQEHQANFPWRRRAAHLRAPLSGRHPRRAPVRKRRRDRLEGAQGAPLQGAEARRPNRPGRGRVHLRPLPAGARRPNQGASRLPRPSHARGPTQRRPAKARRQPAAEHRLGGSGGR